MRLLKTLLIAGTIPLTPLLANADVFWRVADLGTQLTRPVAVNNAGVVVGGIYRADPGIGIQPLLQPASGLLLQSTFTDVNDHGVATGYRREQSPAGGLCPFSRIPINGTISVPFSIRNDGALAGSCETSCSLSIVSARDSYACTLVNGVERRFGFAERDLPPRDGALAINSSGVAVGFALKKIGSAHVERGFIFDPAGNGGTGKIIDVGAFGGSSSRVQDINDAGVAVGRADIDQNPFPGYHAFLYENGTLKDIGVRGDNSSANAINNSGVVVGDYDFDGRRQVRGFVYDPVNGMRDLNDILPLEPGWEIVSATDISESGEIVGTARVNGVLHGYFFTYRDLDRLAPSTPKQLRLKVQYTGPCQKQIKKRKRIKKGTQCTFQTTLTELGGAPASGMSYEVQQSAKRNGPWKKVVVGQSDASGRGKHKIRLKRAGYLRAIYSIGLANESSSSLLKLSVK